LGRRQDAEQAIGRSIELLGNLNATEYLNQARKRMAEL
jgi:hypothetical protein